MNTMGKRQTKIRFFTIADYNEEQAWLEEQHENGWKLVKVTAPCFFTFEECVPEEVSYRLEFNQTKATDDYLQMYEDYGWEYIGGCMNWSYFRKPVVESTAEGENEIFSDDESRLNMIDRAIPRRRIACVMTCHSSVSVGTKRNMTAMGIMTTFGRCIAINALIYCPTVEVFVTI